MSQPLANSRRSFLKKSTLATFSAIIGADIVYANNFPDGLLPVILKDQEDPYKIIGKNPGLTIFNDRPWNVETPPHLLNDPITPADRLFIRNNGTPPKNINIDNWTLTITGESAKGQKVFTIAELKSKFQIYEYQLTIECGGNGRSEFSPPAKGNQWTTGAVGCPKWRGVRLRNVLQSVGIKDDAIYIGYYGKDTHLSGDANKNSISRGVPIKKAMEDESLIAFAMNREDIPFMNGHPLRLVFGGWPASTSGKWLEKIVIRNKIHDGEKMGGQSYRVPCKPVSPASNVPDDEMCIIESMPVKSLITNPKTGATLSQNSRLVVNGHAWAGDLEVLKMEVSIDFGANWIDCQLDKPVNRLAWQHWNTELRFQKKGYYEV